MATIPFSADTDRGESRFFFTMACVMAATIVGGFLFNIVTGRSSFALPLVVHLHAFVMMGWVGLYLTQNFLVFSDNVALHRRLGWLSVVLVPAILLMGLARAAAKDAIRQNLAIPLEVAGFGEVTVNVRFDGEALPAR